METGKKVLAWCHICKKNVEPQAVNLVKWRNRKSKSGTVEAWEGTCPTCRGKVYKIRGH